MAKYIFGDAPFSMPFMFACMLTDGLILGAVLIGLGPAGAVQDAFPTPSELHGVAAVSGVFAIVIYTLLGNQVGIKFAENLSQEEKEVCAKIAERGVYNNMEQTVQFLIGLWLCALFVNPRTTAVLGWIYIAMRFLYPIAYGFYGVFNNFIEVVQQMVYSINGYFIIALLYKVSSQSDLHTDVAGVSPYLMALVAVACPLLITVLFLVGGKPGSAVIMKGVAWDRAYTQYCSDTD